MNDNNQPPCYIDEIIIQTFNFDNLKRYIEYIDSNSKKALSQIYEIKLKLVELDDFKTNLNETNTRLDNFS